MSQSVCVCVCLHETWHSHNILHVRSSWPRHNLYTCLLCVLLRSSRLLCHHLLYCHEENRWMFEKGEKTGWAFSEGNLFSPAQNRCPRKNWCLYSAFSVILAHKKLAGDELFLWSSSPQWFWEISRWQLRLLQLDVGNLEFDVSKIWTPTAPNTTDLFKFKKWQEMILPFCVLYFQNKPLFCWIVLSETSFTMAK